MFNQTFYNALTAVDDVIWTYMGIYFVLLAGLYLTIKSRGFQFKAISDLSIYKSLYAISKDKNVRGINPFKLYFASVGGMIGLGNIVAVVSAVLYGGPGALFWLWIAAFAGMLIKYSDIYLGIVFRKPHKGGGYDGGPMFYLKRAFHNKALPILSCVLLCVYGAEVFQFKIIADTISQTFELDWLCVAIGLALLVLYSSIGGIKRLATISTVLMPFFIVCYILMCVWVIIQNVGAVPELFIMIMKSAFVGQAPMAGFLGSTALAAIHFGTARAVYSGDVGIGYDSIVQSETKSKRPGLQARLAIFGQLTDLIVCTGTLMVVLLTGTWKDPLSSNLSSYIIKSMGIYFPHMDVFMSLLFFVAGYTTIIAYFTVGIKCATFINKKIGKKIYVVYAMCAFMLTKYTNQTNLILLMSIAGGMLVLMNVSAIIKLRKFVKFD